MTVDGPNDFDAFLTHVATEDAAAVREVVATVRRGDRRPAEAIKALDGWYLRGQAIDAGVRTAASAVPLLGPAAPEAGEPLASLRRTAVYLLALADLYGVDLDEPDERKALVSAVLLGDEGASMASEALGAQGGRWARQLGATRAVSRLAGGNALVGMLVQKVVDGGVSAALASGSEAVRARAVVQQARRAFGTPPARFPGQKPRAAASGPRPADPPSNTAIYARALARTIHKQRKRLKGS